MVLLWFNFSLYFSTATMVQISLLVGEVLDLILHHSTLKDKDTP